MKLVISVAVVASCIIGVAAVVSGMAQPGSAGPHTVQVASVSAMHRLFPH